MMLLSSFYRAVFLSWLLLAIVEESVTVSGQGVTVDLNGFALPNNSLLNFEDIPNVSITGGIVDDSLLNCRTDLEACCNAGQQNLPAPVGEWYYPDGTALPFDTSPAGGTTFRRNRGLMNVRLWRRDTPTERGRFRCELPNAQNVNQIVYVNILNIGPVTITASGGSNTGIAGTSFSLVCSATVETQNDTPTPNFDWFFGTKNDSLPSGATPVAAVMGNSYTSTLQFSPLQESHAGMYTCRLGSNARLAVNAMVTVNRPDITARVSASGSPVLGQSGYSLTCDVTGDENLSSTRTYQWTRDNGNTQTQVGTNSNSLFFSSLSLTDAGRYTCSVTVSSPYLDCNVMSSNSEDVMLEIHNPSVTVTSNPPSPIMDGTDFTVSCAVEMAQGVVDSDLSLLMVDAQLSRDGTPLTLTGPTVTGTTFTYTIQLDSFGRNASGNYTCSATVTRVQQTSTYLTGSGQATTVVEIVVVPLPDVTPSIPRVVLVGTATSFNCTATNNATITWTVVDESNGPVSFTGPTVDGDTSTIMVTFASTGDYNVTCNATNGRGSVTESGMSNAVSIEADDLTVGITATATFFCNVTGLTDPSLIQYLWRQTQNGVFSQTPFPVVIFGSRVNDTAAPTLMITNVGPMDDDFDYTCRVSNSNGGRIVGDATGTLTTNGPMITTGPVDQTLNAGMDRELSCTAVNNDGATRPLVISWLFTPLGQGAPVYYAVTDSEVTQTVDNDTVTSVLRIDSVVSTDSGMYGCHAYNRNLEDAVVENATVIVFFTPQVELRASPPMVQDGMAQTLTCTVTALPVANFAEIVRFSSTGERMVVASDNNMAGDMQFTLTHTFTANFSADDGALYQCLAVNDNGPNSVNVTIIVQAIPDAIDHSQVSHVLVTLTSINVTWPIPSDNNAPITEYIINLCLIFTNNNNETACVTNTSIPVTSPDMLPENRLRYELGEIVAQRSYEIYIQAENSVGSPAYTPLTNGYRFDSVSVVNGSVTNLRFVPTTSVVIITWNLPAIALATSGVEAEFNLTYFRQGNQVLSTETVIISYNMALTEQGYSVDLSVLDGGPYTFIVTALYTSPISLLSTEVMDADIETVGADVALLPNERVMDAVSGTSITFSWPAPENVNFLMNYRVSYSSTPIPTSKRRRRQSPSSDSLTVPADMRSTDLVFQPYSMYMVDVDAIYNPPNSGEVTVRLLPTTPITTPQETSGPPSFSQQPTRQDGFFRIVLSWIPPANPNGVITGYKVFVNQSRIGSEVVPVGLVTSWTTPEFQPNTEHTFEVAAINGAPINNGQGVYSSVVTAKTGFGVIQPVIANAVIGTSDNRQFTIAFGPFSSRFGAVGTYQIVVIRNGDISNTLGLRSELLLPENRSSTNYYVAFSGNVPRVQTSFIIGDGMTRRFGNDYFPNPPPETGVNYQVFIRVYSQFDPNVYNDSSLTSLILTAGVPIAVIITVPTILLVLIFIATLIIVIIVIKIRKKEVEDYYSEVGPPPLPMRMEMNTSHQQGLQTFQVLNVGDHGQNPAAHIATALVDENSLKTKQATTTSENPAYGATKVPVTTAENTPYQANELDATTSENPAYGATDVAVTTSENPAYGATEVAVTTSENLAYGATDVAVRTSENPAYITNFTDLSNGNDTET